MSSGSTKVVVMWHVCRCGKTAICRQEQKKKNFTVGPRGRESGRGGRAGAGSVCGVCVPKGLGHIHGIHQLVGSRNYVGGDVIHDVRQLPVDAGA
jgi:hypothetical protein